MKAFLDERGIKCKRIPEHVQARAVRLIQSLEAGATIREHHGRRMLWDHSLISFPIGRWRLTASERKGRLVFRKLLSHEDYNSNKNR